MGAVLHARRNDSLPPLTVVGRTPLRAIDVRDAGAERAGEVGDPAGRAAGGRPDDGPRVGRDARPHGADAAGARRAGRARRTAPDGSVAWTVRGGVAVQAIDGTGPGRRLGGGVLAGRGRDPSRRRADAPRRRRQPDPPRGHRHPALDGRRHRRAAARRRRPTTASASRWPTWSSARRALRAIDLGPADVAAAIDEIPVLCLAAAAADGTTVIRGAGELRHKESDRIAGIAAGLRGAGRAGRGRRRRPAHRRRRDPRAAPTTDSLDDHRLAMTFAIAGLVAAGETVDRAARARPRSPIPGFFDDLERVRA